MERKKSLNDEKSFYLNNNRPRLEVFRKLTINESKSICNENNQYIESNSDEIAIAKQKQIALSSICDFNKNNNFKQTDENNLKNESFNIVIKIENKALSFEDLDFSVDDNFKRLKSDLIPKENSYFDMNFQDLDEQEEFFNFKNQKINIKQDRKHSY